MKNIPFDIGVLHFVGIGGIGMSGIAEVLHNLGYAVQGSDQVENANVARLKKMSIPVFIGQRAENLGPANVVVVSTAIGSDNPEVQEARRHHLPVVRRAEMLAELMRLKWCVSVAGTHGKTTVTSMVAKMLDSAGFDPTVINGGIINAYGTNARLGTGNWMVVEADESDGTFVKLPATIAIVTNIDPEHLDFYGDFATEKAAFKTFLERVPFYGAAVLCIDHDEVRRLIPQIKDRKIISYGFSQDADVQAVNVRFEKGISYFDVVINDNHMFASRRITGFYLSMPGHYNVQNALAAITVGLQMNIDPEKLCEALADFGGVKRRFTKVGEAAGITVIDDYGHHPVEIAAVLNAARNAYDGKIIAVVQPHRYSRLDVLFEEFCSCFGDADTVLVTPVYAAGEQPIEGVDHRALVQGIKTQGHDKVAFIDEEEALAAMVKRYAGAGDVVICLGAGSITTWAAALPDALEQMSDGQ